MVTYQALGEFEARSSEAAGHGTTARVLGGRRSLGTMNLLGANSLLIVRVGFRTNSDNEQYSTCDATCILVRS